MPRVLCFLPAQFCPGRAADAQFGGAKPTLVASGASRIQTQVDAVEKRLTLSISCSLYNAVAVRNQLVMLYNIAAALMELSDPCSSHRRLGTRSWWPRHTQQSGTQQLDVQHRTFPAVLRRTLQADTLQGIQVVLTIRDPVGSTDIGTLATAVDSVSDAALSTSLRTALGVTVTVASLPAQRTTVQVEVQAACPPGSFSKVGECAPCRPGSFSDASGNSECTDCATGTYQAAPGATRCDVCGAGNYSANILSCEPCQLGEYCEAGVSPRLFALPPPFVPSLFSAQKA